MRRADRLFQIVQLLKNRRLTTAADMAATLEVSTRTVYRDVQDLIESGVPIEGEAGVGYLAMESQNPAACIAHAKADALNAGAAS